MIDWFWLLVGGLVAIPIGTWLGIKLAEYHTRGSR